MMECCTHFGIFVFQLLSDNLMLLFKESASELFLTASLLHSDECVGLAVGRLCLTMTEKLLTGKSNINRNIATHSNIS